MKLTTASEKKKRVMALKNDEARLFARNPHNALKNSSIVIIAILMLYN